MIAPHDPHRRFHRALTRALGVTTLLLVVAAARDARATTLVRLSADEHAESAAAVVIATPKRIATQLDETPSGREVFTYTTLDVREVLKGTIDPTRKLVLKHPGGRFGSTSRSVAGTPDLACGVEYLLFLAADPRPPYECYFVQSFELGVWRTERQGGRVWAVRAALPSAFSITLPPGSASVSDRVLLDRVRRIGRHSPRASAPQVPRSYTPASAEDVSSPRPSFTLHDPPCRWFEPDTNAPVAIYVNTTSFTFAGNLSEALDWAAAEWSSVAGSSLRVLNGGPTDACGFNPLNQVSSVSVDCANEVPGQGCRGSGVVAIGGPRTYADEYTTIDGLEYRRIRTGDVVLNDGGMCDLFDNQASLDAVVTHELGHVLGLEHSEAGTPGDRPTMYPYIVVGMDTLHEDDREAIRFVYPAPEPPAAAPSLDDLAPPLVEQDGDEVLRVEARNVSSILGSEIAIAPPDGISWELLAVTPTGADQSLLEVRLRVDESADVGTRSIVVATAGGQSNPLTFAVSSMLAPRDLAASREPGRGKRRAVLLAWTDTSAVETSIRVERLDPRTGAFRVVDDGYLPADSTAFRDARPRKKTNTYRVGYHNTRTGAVAYSNTVTIGR